MAVWTAVGSGMLTLLIAANKKEQEHTCKKFIVTIKGSGATYAIDKADVIRLLQSTPAGKLIGKPLSEFNLARLEQKLKTNMWIGEADIYFDSQDALHVLVTEKEPIARVFTAAGNSFYLDSEVKRMPLLEKVSIRLPVFTNFPDGRIMKAKDSALLQDVKHLAHFIANDAFWKAQIAQIDIAGNNTFEAIPVIGNHIIKIGKAEDLDAKFNKLFVFYKNVLSKTGFDKYSVLDIQFNSQVVATHKGVGSAIDSLQLKRNIQELLTKNSLQLQNGTEGATEVKPEVFINSIDTTTVKDTPPASALISKEPDVKKIKTDNPVVKRNPTPVKPKLKPATSKPVRKTEAASKRKPKAVMPRRTAG